MLETDVERIMTQIFAKRWPKWEMDGEEVQLWRHVLAEYDYNAAVGAINNFYMTQTTGVKPQAARLTKALRVLRKSEEARKNDPVHIFTVVRESQIGTLLEKQGYRFACNEKNMPQDPQRIEDCSLYYARELGRMVGEPMIVRQEWQGYYKKEEELPF